MNFRRAFKNWWTGTLPCYGGPLDGQRTPSRQFEGNQLGGGFVSRQYFPYAEGYYTNHGDWRGYVWAQVTAVAPSSPPRTGRE
jgi:hypothetical protein